MPEIQVQCDCGQPYKFDVEPVDGQMPGTVACPTCGVDGTEKANVVLRQPHPAPAQPRLRLASAAPAAPESPNVAPPPLPPSRPAMAPAYAAPVQEESGSNFGMGILGAILGAAVGAGLMYGFFMMTEFRFPLMGVGTGALTGLGARLMFRGTDHSLGVVSAIAAAIAVVGTLYAMYGEFPIFNIISVIVSISIAYRVAS